MNCVTLLLSTLNLMKKNTPKSEENIHSTEKLEKAVLSDAEIKAKETEENLEKMAKKLNKEWNKPLKPSETPDLSFSKFEEKLKNKDQ